MLGEGVATAWATAGGEGDDGPVPTPTFDAGVGGKDEPKLTSIAIPRASQAAPAAKMLDDLNAGSFVRIPKALVASQTAARLKSPNTPTPGLVKSWTIQNAITRYARTATTCFHRFPVRKPGIARHQRAREEGAPRGGPPGAGCGPVW